MKTYSISGNSRTGYVVANYAISAHNPLTAMVKFTIRFRSLGMRLGSITRIQEV